MSKGKVRIGIVGSGGMANNNARNIAHNNAAELVAIASRNIETGSNLAKQYNAHFMPNWHEMVQRKDLDGIVVCTANDSHSEIIIGSLEYNKHVFTEYPTVEKNILETQQNNESRPRSLAKRKGP